MAQHGGFEALAVGNIASRRPIDGRRIGRNHRQGDVLFQRHVGVVVVERVLGRVDHGVAVLTQAFGLHLRILPVEAAVRIAAVELGIAEGLAELDAVCGGPQDYRGRGLVDLNRHRFLRRQIIVGLFGSDRHHPAVALCDGGELVVSILQLALAVVQRRARHRLFRAGVGVQRRNPAHVDDRRSLIHLDVDRLNQIILTVIIVFLCRFVGRIDHRVGIRLPLRRTFRHKSRLTPGEAAVIVCGMAQIAISKAIAVGDGALHRRPIDGRVSLVDRHAARFHAANDIVALVRARQRKSGEADRLVLARIRVFDAGACVGQIQAHGIARHHVPQRPALFGQRHVGLAGIFKVCGPLRADRELPRPDVHRAGHIGALQLIVAFVHTLQRQRDGDALAVSDILGFHCTAGRQRNIVPGEGVAVVPIRSACNGRAAVVFAAPILIRRGSGGAQHTGGDDEVNPCVEAIGDSVIPLEPNLSGVAAHIAQACVVVRRELVVALGQKYVYIL